MTRCWIFAVASLACSAQTVPSIQIYSQFERPDPFGHIVLADRSPEPREILSPAVPRNAWATFHVAVSVPPGTDYLLYAAPNPVNSCGVELYKEHFVHSGNEWIPDTLARVNRLMDFGVMPDPDEQIPGQTTRVYLLDLWIPPDADLKGFRMEVQLKVGYFLVAPMEVRVLAARVPPLPAAGKDAPLPLPNVAAGSDISAMGPLTQYFSTGRAGPIAGGPPTVRAILARNGMQDAAYAASLPEEKGGPAALKRFCDSIPRNTGAEWYLRLRDYLYGRKP